MGSTSVVLDHSWCGPPGVANGGIVAGLLSEALGPGGAEVVLRRPVPLDRALRIADDDSGSATLHDSDGSLLAEARPIELDLPVLPPPSADQLDDAAVVDGYAAHHPYPECFVCGPARSAGDGLGLFPHPIAEGLSPRFATRWAPGTELCDGDGRVAGLHLWAALDCPSSFPFMAPERTALLLGTMRAEIHSRPSAGADLVVTSWAVRSHGRKHVGGAAIFEGRQLVGRAEAIWIEPRPS